MARNSDGGYFYATSPGWQGETMPYTGTYFEAGETEQFQNVPTKRGPAKYHVSHKRRCGGQWKTVGGDTWTKCWAFSLCFGRRSAFDSLGEVVRVRDSRKAGVVAA